MAARTLKEKKLIGTQLAKASPHKALQGLIRMQHQRYNSQNFKIILF